MVIFVEGLHVNILIRTFCVSADDFQGLPKALQCAIQLSLKLVTNFEMLTKPSTEFPSLWLVDVL